MSNVSRPQGRTTAVLIVLAATILILNTGFAAARDKDQQMGTTVGRAAVNLDKHPEMVFERGLLSQAAHGGWALDEYVLVFDRASQVVDPEDAHSTPSLSSGREAMVMGYLRDGTLVVHCLTLVSPTDSLERGSFNTETVEAVEIRAAPAGAPK